jgi:endonuclease G
MARSAFRQCLAVRLLLPLTLVSVLLVSSALAALATSSGLAMGNPSQATADPQSPENYLLDKPYYAPPSNSTLGTPNWVSWRFTKADTGKAPCVAFYPDRTLPGGFQQVLPNDHRSTGFQRGHVCPHEGRSATNAMSNMVPQSRPLNTEA